MGFKLKTALLSLLFTVCFFIPLLLAAESTIPLPADALKVAEKSAYFGPIKTITKFYLSSLTKAQVDSFYKKAMLRSGWTISEDGVFRKNKYLAVIKVDPIKDEAGKTHFSNTISNIPEKEEFQALAKVKPEKLSFMPIYPVSRQVFLWNTPFGVAASYGTESSIKEVVFFYKSGMLSYGWILDKESPIETKAIDDCPECRKASQGAIDSVNSKVASSESTASLIFSKKDGERCIIIVSSTPVTDGDLSLNGNNPHKQKNISLAGETIISVNYNKAYQRIK